MFTYIICVLYLQSAHQKSFWPWRNARRKLSLAHLNFLIFTLNRQYMDLFLQPVFLLWWITGSTALTICQNNGKVRGQSWDIGRQWGKILDGLLLWCRQMSTLEFIHVVGDRKTCNRMISHACCWSNLWWWFIHWENTSLSLWESFLQPSFSVKMLSDNDMLLFVLYVSFIWYLCCLNKCMSPNQATQLW